VVYANQVMRYNTELNEVGIFVHYINMFLKLKAEASGYPSRVQDPEYEERYIRSLWERERIRLHMESIMYNEEKRGLAKLCHKSMREN